MAPTPLALMAVVRALAPGIGTTGKPAAVTSRTKRWPGSLTPGVPASLTSAKRSPASSRAIAPAALRASVWASWRSSGARTPWWSHNTRVTRVSSHRIRSTERSTRIARSVMSSRFPMGVATT
ncbi:MAG: hypothetical protein CVU56_07470 [Deltaproteobacteria bacterium HGW-Deltaproteobacteria-14]|nr:MAG: hypothetical protein CVU56_07470 [Deltaproteobacteria bacterium HGW-Deltaproteobacteria-14]